MRRHRIAVVPLVAILLAIVAAPGATAQARAQPPKALTDAEFWQLFVTASEPSGNFSSENFVSNEIQFQEPIPTLQRTLSANGVYIGVGPDQNFTYIANLQPRMAVIIDIRRQNAMLHLMYKALFELSPTRAQFVERLFSRPLGKRLPATFNVTQLFESCEASAPNDSAFDANRIAVIALLTKTHHFDLSAYDVETIDYLLTTFFNVGPRVNYGARQAGLSAIDLVRSSYATFAFLQNATTADGVQMAFLTTDDRYRVVRDLEMRNLVVPVVGDFGGPKAIRSVATFLRDRSLTVTAFYTSNVEQFLFNGPARAADPSLAYARFYASVATLPTDSTTMFIRSVPRAQIPGAAYPRPQPAAGAGVGRASGSIQLGGRGSAFPPGFGGVQGVGSFIVDLPTGVDTATRVHQSFAGGRMVDHPEIVPITMFTIPATASLINGIAPMRLVLDEFNAGRITAYPDVIALTKATGWK